MATRHGVTKLSLCLGVAVLALTAGPGTMVQAQEPPAGTEAIVSVGSVSVGAGLTGAVTVVVTDVSGLYGADVQLSFDPAVVEAVDADPDAEGIQIVLGDFLSPDFVLRNTADNDAGTVHFALTQINPSEAQSGTGELFSVLFEGVSAGASTPIKIESATLASRSGEKMPSQSEDGVVHVVSAAEAPATPTAAPVARPTLIVPTGSAAGQRDMSRTDDTAADADSAGEVDTEDDQAEGATSSGDEASPSDQPVAADQGGDDGQGQGAESDRASGSGQESGSGDSGSAADDSSAAQPDAVEDDNGDDASGDEDADSASGDPDTGAAGGGQAAGEADVSSRVAAGEASGGDPDESSSRGLLLAAAVVVVLGAGGVILYNRQRG